jgi:hypothetical protein
MGRGVELEVGNTIYFDMSANQFSYWNTDDAGRSMINDCIHSGHIDCLHSYGDFAANRSHAQRAIDELQKHNCKLEVWIDHAVAPTNFGPDIMRGRGDIPGSDTYHADISLDFGIRFVWLGRVTSVIGQDTDRRLRGLWNTKNIPLSSKTLVKEFLKGAAASLGIAKYAIHKPNRLIREVELRDGRPVFEFLRSNPHYGGVSCGETADGIAEVLVPRILDRLVQSGGVCILYTHLGKVSNSAGPFGPATVAAFRRLSGYYSRGELLVTTTGRVLNYCLMKRDITLSCSPKDGFEVIDIETRYPNGLDGLTLYCEVPERTRVLVNGRHVAGLQRNLPDHAGRRSISFPWKRLEFPAI